MTARRLVVPLDGWLVLTIPIVSRIVFSQHLAAVMVSEIIENRSDSVNEKRPMSVLYPIFFIVCPPGRSLLLRTGKCPVSHEFCIAKYAIMLQEVWITLRLNHAVLVGFLLAFLAVLVGFRSF